MKRLFAILDYKNQFGSKYDAIPYRSGFNKKKLTSEFFDLGFYLDYIHFSQISEKISDPLLITSSEDNGNHYKHFLEDIILHLERNHKMIIPSYDLLKAHNNKVYMELLRSLIGHLWGDTLKSKVFGCVEELEQVIDQIELPVVIKRYDGSLSRGVHLAKTKDDLLKKAKSVSRIKLGIQDLKDWLRPFRHKGYIRESFHRNKFILQQFIPNLKNDWKVLVWGERLFILTRHTRKNDFRASGSHVNYLAGSKSLMPEGILDFAVLVRDSLDTPHVSLDIVYDGKKFHVVEFQAIYFGTSTCNMSDVYFKKDNGEWKMHKNDLSIEQLYADSVCWYLEK